MSLIKKLWERHTANVDNGNAVNVTGSLNVPNCTGTILNPSWTPVTDFLTGTHTSTDSSSDKSSPSVLPATKPNLPEKTAYEDKKRIGEGGAPTRATTLPDDAADRKNYPIATGVLDYFPKCQKQAMINIIRAFPCGGLAVNPAMKRILA
jgi:hypothetical protein